MTEAISNDSIPIKKSYQEFIYKFSPEFVSSESEDEKVRVRGLALPFNEVSRNGHWYIEDSIRETYQSMIGVTVHFNHVFNRPLGHVSDAWIEEDGLHFEMDLDPKEEDLIRKMKRKDIKHVSVMVGIDENKSYIDENGVPALWVVEHYELSVVTVPGYKQTTSNFESLVKRIQEHSEVISMATENKTKETEQDVSQDSDDDKKKYDERLEQLEDAVSKLQEMLTDHEGRITGLESGGDDGDDDEDDDDDSEDVSDSGEQGESLPSKDEVKQKVDSTKDNLVVNTRSEQSNDSEEMTEHSFFKMGAKQFK